MIPYDFDYKRADSIDEALSLLTDLGPQAKLLAGGHSLIPAMKLRLSAPSTLIDVSGIEDLTEIHDAGDTLEIGALVTHRSVEFSELVQAKCKVLSEAASHIGDPQVRNRGTIGGNLAHADPSSDYPALVLGLGADIEVVSPSDTRTIAADAFFTGMFETALRDDEIITKVVFPVLGARTGASYAKFANPASRYAIVGVAAMLSVDDGVCTSARIGVTGAAATAFRATSVEEALVGSQLDDEHIAAAVVDMVDPDEMMSELSGSAEYRAHLCSVMTRRAIEQAAARASEAADA